MFLEELIRLEGRGIFTDGKCELCRKVGVYRCVDCLAVQFLCTGCMSRVHSFNPFHVIEVSPLVSWVILHSPDTLANTEVERLVLRKILSPGCGSPPPARSSPCRIVYKTPAQHQDLHDYSHQRNSPRQPCILWVQRGWELWHPSPTTPPSTTLPRNVN
jgi:hypothetical protein